MEAEEANQPLRDGRRLQPRPEENYNGRGQGRGKREDANGFMDIWQLCKGESDNVRIAFMMGL